MIQSNKKWYRTEMLDTTEWLLHIPDRTVRLKALLNMARVKRPIIPKSGSLDESLHNSFNWHSSTEGATYWMDYSSKIDKNMNSIRLNKKMNK